MTSRTERTLAQNHIGNTLLQSLNHDDWNMLQPVLENWTASPGTPLYSPGDPMGYAYFPRGSGLISCMVELEDGSIVETALIGREGAIGGLVSHGSLSAFCRTEVQLGGDFLRIGIRKLENAKARSTALHHMFARYADCLFAQMLQAVACKATHSIEQRSARSLLTAIERTGTTDLALTQEQLATTLGVGRTYLSRVIVDFKEQGVIETRRGRLVVRNVDRLRALSCQCNTATGRHFNEVMKGLYPSGDDDLS